MRLGCLTEFQPAFDHRLVDVIMLRVEQHRLVQVRARLGLAEFTNFYILQLTILPMSNRIFALHSSALAAHRRE